MDAQTLINFLIKVNVLMLYAMTDKHSIQSKDVYLAQQIVKFALRMCQEN